MRTKKSLISILFIAALSVVIVLGQTVAPTLLDFPSGTLIIDTINLGGVSRDSWPGGGFGVNHDQDLNTTDDVTFASVDTGQGANELYDMDQNVLTTSAPTFATVDTGQGANELYDMDQNVLTTSAPTFKGISVDWIQLGVDNETEWPSIGSGSGRNTTGDYKYIVYNVSTNYYAEYNNGTLFNSGADADTVINACLSGLSPNRVQRERVVLLGFFPYNNPLIGYDLTILDATQAYMYLLSGSDCDMFDNADQVYNAGRDRSGNDYISIIGGIWDGNKAGQTPTGEETCHIFHIEAELYQAADKNHSWYGHFGGKIRIIGAYDDAVYLKKCLQWSQSGSIEISNSDDHGFYFHDVSDSWFTGHFKCSSTVGSGLVIYSSTSTHFNTAYFGGSSSAGYDDAHVVIKSCKRIMVNQWRLDYISKHGVLIEGSSRDVVISLLLIGNQRGTNNTYDAVRFDGGCDDNIITTLIVYDKDIAGDSHWKYAVNEEHAGCDWNFVLSGKAEMYQTKTRTQGANSNFAGLAG